MFLKKNQPLPIFERRPLGACACSARAVCCLAWALLMGRGVVPPLSLLLVTVACSLAMNFFQLPGPCVFCHSQHRPAFCSVSRKSRRPLGRPLMMSHECPSSGSKNGSCRSTSSSSCRLRPSCMSTWSAVFCATDTRLLQRSADKGNSCGACM